MEAFRQAKLRDAVAGEPGEASTEVLEEERPAA
jgi:hypothetical protein